MKKRKNLINKLKLITDIFNNDFFYFANVKAEKLEKEDFKHLNKILQVFINEAKSIKHIIEEELK